jgi:hypothetical protein
MHVIVTLYLRETNSSNIMQPHLQKNALREGGRREQYLALQQHAIPLVHNAPAVASRRHLDRRHGFFEEMAAAAWAADRGRRAHGRESSKRWGGGRRICGRGRRRSAAALRPDLGARSTTVRDAARITAWARANHTKNFAAGGEAAATCWLACCRPTVEEEKPATELSRADLAGADPREARCDSAVGLRREGAGEMVAQEMERAGEERRRPGKEEAGEVVALAAGRRAGGERAQ